MDNNKPMRDFLQEKVNRDIITKYMFIKVKKKNMEMNIFLHFAMMKRAM